MTATVAAWAVVSACSISQTGLAPVQDAAVVASDATLGCYIGTVDRANWPVAATFNTCSMPCGPDNLGSRTCNQIDLASCQALGGCVCLISPCTQCTDCKLGDLPTCYAPTNPASPAACAASVKNGAACSPPCAKTLCLQADGKTGCVCNGAGQYACAAWGGGIWK